MSRKSSSAVPSTALATLPRLETPKGSTVPRCPFCGNPVFEGLKAFHVWNRSSKRRDGNIWLHEGCFADFALPGTPFPAISTSSRGVERKETDGFLYKERLFTDPLDWSVPDHIKAHVEFEELGFQLFHDGLTEWGRMYARTEISQKSLNRGECGLDRLVVPTRSVTTVYPTRALWQRYWPTKSEVKAECPALFETFDAFGITELRIGEARTKGMHIVRADSSSVAAYHIANMVCKEVVKAIMCKRAGIRPQRSPKGWVEYFLQELRDRA